MTILNTNVDTAPQIKKLLPFLFFLGVTDFTSNDILLGPCRWRSCFQPRVPQERMQQDDEQSGYEPTNEYVYLFVTCSFIHVLLFPLC